MINFFKRLFSGSTKEKPENQKTIVSDSTAINETKSEHKLDFGEAKIFPYFMRYENHELKEGQLAAVFHYDQNEKPVILQTIVLQDENGLGLPDNSDMSEEVLDDLDKQASENINNLDLDFKFHPEYQEKIVVAQGPLFTCESILSEEQMLKLHVMLDAEEIMVAIPRRGVMLAAANDLDDGMRKSFLGLHLYIWNDDSEQDDLSRLSKDVFVLKHAEIEGVLYLGD